MPRIREHEYAIRSWHCTILKHQCDYGGNCPGCEYAHLEKGKEEEAEYQDECD